MITANEQLLDRITQRQIYLAQYADGLSVELIKRLKATETDATKTLLYFGARLEGQLLPAKKTRELIKSMRVELASLRSDAWSGIGDTITTELQQLAIDESDFMKTAITASVPMMVPMQLAMATPRRAEIRNAVLQTPFQGKTLDEHLDHMQARDAQILGDRAVMAVQQNTTTPELVLAVMGTLALNRRDGMIRRAMGWTDAITHSAVTSTSTVSRGLFGAANEFMIKKEYFRATLDAATTPICQMNDGKIFKVGQGAQPPLHYRCRSIRISYLDPNISERGFDPSTERTLIDEYTKGEYRSRDALPRGQKGKYDIWARKKRRELIGQVPSEINYSQWLARQSKLFQEDVLGIERARLFRQGNLPLTKFINRQGKYLTLEQLRKKGYDVSVPTRKAA